MRRKALAGFTLQTVTRLDKPETVLLGCFLSFQGDFTDVDDDVDDDDDDDGKNFYHRKI